MSIRSRVLAIAAAGAAVLATTLSAAPANAAPIDVTLPVTGNATVAAQNATLDIPEGANITGAFDLAAGSLDGTLTIPTISAKIRLLGIPGLGDTTSTVNIVQTENTVAQVGPDGYVTADAHFRLDVPRVSSDLLPWINIVRSGCHTGDIDVTLTSSNKFALDGVLDLSGEFTIPKFKGCDYFGARNLLLTSLLGGDGNQLTLKAGPIGPAA